MEISIFNIVLYIIVKANEVLNPLECNFSKERVRDVVMAILTDEEKAEFDTTNVAPCLYDATGHLTVPRGSAAYITDIIQRVIGDLYVNYYIDNHPINRLYITVTQPWWGQVKTYLKLESETHSELFSRIDKYFDDKFGDGK